MSIVKISKKFRDVLNILRSGNIEDGLEQLDKLKEFEPQKAIVRAEIHYFKSDYKAALSYDEQALPHNHQWYAGNVLTEHLFAYSNAAIQSGNSSRAEKFLTSYLGEKEKQSLPEHMLNFYKHQITQHLKKIKGEKGLMIDPKPLSIITNGKNEDAFVAQLKEYRPTLKYDSVDGADYLLHFMFTSADTEEALNYYGRYSDELTNTGHHINAAILLLKTNRISESQNAIRRFVTCWYPVEFIQITPMQLFAYEELFPIFTPELKDEILYMSKAQV